MKALCFYEHGELDVLQYTDVPDPEPGPGEVLVRVRACALNHLDVWVRRGWPNLKLEMPHWTGADIAGEIAGLGERVAGWEVGQQIVVEPGVSTGEDEFTRQGEHSLSRGYVVLGEQVRGGQAEYVTVPAVNLAAVPEGWDFYETAAPLLVGLTAWRMLIRRAKLQTGESVLIVGAGGGVNSMAIQIAKLAGATVYALTSSEEKITKATALGADVVLNYRENPNWSEIVYKMTGRRGVDVVVDNVGRATLAQSMRVVVRGGRIVIVGNTSGPKVEIDTRLIFGKQISIIGSTMGSRQDFQDMLKLLWGRKITPVVDRVIPLSDGKEAFRVLEQGEQFGKIVLVP
ncbi:MAG: alcohol dehydrogenase [Chloroflexi bacterium]|nr:MAG: alcohol dehydrogenase [Chloroflexota bacterium]RLC83740.1 MAG: alcohol dehydrogenase [Chloroflexota bacterium]